MRGKCKRGHGSANADGGSVNAGAEVQTQTGRVRKSSRAMGARRGRLSTPWLRFHGVDRADVYIIIHVRACCCGECALNPPTSRPTPAEDLRSPPHSDTPSPSTSAPPRSPDARPQAVRCTPRRPHNPFPAEDFRSSPHSDTPSRAFPLPHAVPTHAHRLRDAFPAALTTPSPPKTSARPRTATRPSRALLLAPAAPTHARRLRDARPPTSQLIPRSATLPPLLFRFGHKKTAPHSTCAMPNVSVDRRCGRSFELVSRALFAAVAGRWRVGVGLRPQPWALRSRRCGRVLRA